MNRKPRCTVRVELTPELRHLLEDAGKWIDGRTYRSGTQRARLPGMFLREAGLLLAGLVKGHQLDTALDRAPVLRRFLREDPTAFAHLAAGGGASSRQQSGGTTDALCLEVSRLSDTRCQRPRGHSGGHDFFLTLDQVEALERAPLPPAPSPPRSFYQLAAADAVPPPRQCGSVARGGRASCTELPAHDGAHSDGDRTWCRGCGRFAAGRLGSGKGLLNRAGYCGACRP